MTSPRLDRRAFGPFEIELETGELWRDGRPVKLAPQPFQLLALLVARGGALVARDELRSAIWSDGTTVEFDQGLNFCMRQVRIALGDDARRPRYIETVPKRGYRLMVRVTSAAAEGAVPLRSPAPRRRSGVSARTGVAILVIGGVVAAGSQLLREATRWREPSQVQRLRLEAEYLAGTFELAKVRRAAGLLEEATTLAPEDAAAWAGLANAADVLAQLESSPDMLAESERAARRALKLDPTLAEASAALGHAYWQQWRWREADQAFARALAEDPAEPTTSQLYGLYLASSGRAEAAVAQARRAVDLAPTSGLVNFSLAQVYLHTGHPEAALAQARRTLALDRHFPLAFRVVLRASLQLGRATETLETLEEEHRFVPERPEPWEAYVLAHLGRVAEARHLLLGSSGATVRPLGHIAALAELGETDETFAALDAAVTHRSPVLIWLKVTPELAPLHRDARFAELLARMHCC